MIAYGLRADYEGTATLTDDDGTSRDVPLFLGGVIAVDGHDFNVRDELDKGNGTIVVEETSTALIIALDEYPALKRVSVTQDAAPTVSAYEARNVTELRNELKGRNLNASGSRDELVARLEAHDHAVATGDATTAADPTPENPGPDGTNLEQEA